MTAYALHRRAKRGQREALLLALGMALGWLVAEASVFAAHRLVPCVTVTAPARPGLPES